MRLFSSGSRNHDRTVLDLSNWRKPCDINNHGRFEIDLFERLPESFGQPDWQSGFRTCEVPEPVSDQNEGVPDAVIQSSVYLAIETKIQAGTVRTQQLQRHLKRLHGVPAEVKWLIVLTNDNSLPSEVRQLQESGEPIVWASFRMLDQAINELMSDRMQFVRTRAVSASGTADHDGK